MKNIFVLLLFWNVALRSSQDDLYCVRTDSYWHKMIKLQIGKLQQSGKDPLNDSSSDSRRKVRSKSHSAQVSPEKDTQGRETLWLQHT